MTNIKKTWQTIKSMIRTENKDNSIKAIIVKGQNISDPLQIADSFNSYFTGIGESLSKNIPNAKKTFGDYMPSSVLDSIALLPTCPQELMTISRSLKEPFSSGVDELNPQAITAAINLLVEPLAEVINCSLKMGLVPDEIKKAKIIILSTNRVKERNYKTIDQFQ